MKQQEFEQVLENTKTVKDLFLLAQNKEIKAPVYISKIREKIFSIKEDEGYKTIEMTTTAAKSILTNTNTWHFEENVKNNGKKIKEDTLKFAGILAKLGSGNYAGSYCTIIFKVS